MPSNDIVLLDVQRALFYLIITTCFIFLPAPCMIDRSTNSSGVRLGFVPVTGVVAGGDDDSGPLSSGNEEKYSLPGDNPPVGYLPRIWEEHLPKKIFDC